MIYNRTQFNQLVYQVKRAIAQDDMRYQFLYQLENQYRGKGKPLPRCQLSGLFHEKYVRVIAQGDGMSSGDSGKVRKVPESGLMVLYSDWMELPEETRPQNNDWVEIQSRWYKVLGSVDLGNLGLVIAVSLEEFEDGRTPI